VTFYKTFLSTLTSTKKFKSGKDRGGVAVLKEIVDGVEFSKVHYHALRRILTLLRLMQTSWWAEQGDGSQLVDIMALSILRPDNLSRAVPMKEQTTIKEAVGNLITHCSSIFVVSNDSAARRQSMIRRGERASRMQLLTDDGEMPDSGRRRLSNFDTPRIDLELRAEFKAYREQTNAQINSLLETVAKLQEEIDALKVVQKEHDHFISANGSEIDSSETPRTPKSRRTDSLTKMVVTTVGIDSPKKKSSSRSLEGSGPTRKDSKKALKRSESEDREDSEHEDKKHKKSKK
jgi:hypothetical protein